MNRQRSGDVHTVSRCVTTSTNSAPNTKYVCVYRSAFEATVCVPKIPKRSPTIEIIAHKVMEPAAILLATPAEKYGDFAQSAIIAPAASPSNRNQDKPYIASESNPRAANAPRTTGVGTKIAADTLKRFRRLKTRTTSGQRR